jgi:hypothetical protein
MHTRNELAKRFLKDKKIPIKACGAGCYSAVCHCVDYIAEFTAEGFIFDEEFVPFERSSSTGAGSLGVRRFRKIESFSHAALL